VQGVGIGIGVLGILVVLVLLRAVKIVQEYERAVIFRLGRCIGAKGPGIFYRLGAVKAGDQVKIGRADGSTATFVVDKVASYPKDQFPTEEVYRGDFTQSEIRLVTCGGTFDKVKHYLDNVIVFAHLRTTS